MLILSYIVLISLCVVHRSEAQDAVQLGCEQAVMPATQQARYVDGACFVFIRDEARLSQSAAENYCLQRQYLNFGAAEEVESRLAYVIDADRALMLAKSQTLIPMSHYSNLWVSGQRINNQWYYGLTADPSRKFFESSVSWDKAHNEPNRDGNAFFWKMSSETNQVFYDLPGESNGHIPYFVCEHRVNQCDGECLCEPVSLTCSPFSGVNVTYPVKDVCEQAVMPPMQQAIYVDDGCYVFVDSKVSQSDAENYCTQREYLNFGLGENVVSHLAYIIDADHALELANLQTLLPLSHYSNLWVGAQRINDQWYYGLTAETDRKFSESSVSWDTRHNEPNRDGNGMFWKMESQTQQNFYDIPIEKNYWIPYFVCEHRICNSSVTCGPRGHVLEPPPPSCDNTLASNQPLLDLYGGQPVQFRYLDNENGKTPNGGRVELYCADSAQPPITTRLSNGYLYLEPYITDQTTMDVAQVYCRAEADPTVPYYYEQVLNGSSKALSTSEGGVDVMNVMCNVCPSNGSPVLPGCPNGCQLPGYTDFGVTTEKIVVPGPGNSRPALIDIGKTVDIRCATENQCMYSVDRTQSANSVTFPCKQMGTMAFLNHMVTNLQYTKPCEPCPGV